MILLQRNLILDEIVENKQASQNAIPELHPLIEIQSLYTTTKLEEGILSARRNLRGENLAGLENKTEKACQESN